MTATYTFDVFSSLDGFGGVSGGDWGATGASRAQNCSTAASHCTARSSEWSWAPTLTGCSHRCWP